MFLLRVIRNQKFRLTLGWIFFAGGLILWPLSAFTWAKEEPQFVLGLSFMALIFEGFNGIQIADDEID